MYWVHRDQLRIRQWLPSLSLSDYKSARLIHCFGIVSWIHGVQVLEEWRVMYVGIEWGKRGDMMAWRFLLCCAARKWRAKDGAGSLWKEGVWPNAAGELDSSPTQHHCSLMVYSERERRKLQRLWWQP